MKTTPSAIVRVALTCVVVAGLAVDAFVHFDLASTYDVVRSATLSEGDLFRAEGSLAVLVAVALVLHPRRYTALAALLVTAGGLAAVLVYQYIDVGAFGPFPNMYEPVWFTEKTQSAWAEAIGAVAAFALLVLLHLRTRASRRPSAALHPVVAR